MSSARRILYVITDLQIGGVPLHLLRLAKHVKQVGHEVRVVSLAPPGPLSRRFDDAGIETVSCHAESVFGIGALLRLRKEIARFKPDFVHSFLFHANLACRVVCPLAGSPSRNLICEIQTVEIQRRWHLVLDRWTQSWCRFEIGNSPAVVRHLHEQAGLAQSRLRLVMGAVDAQRFSDAEPVPRAQLGVHGDVPLLLWVGRLDPVKGLDTLVHAARIVQDTRPAHWILVGDGPDRARIENLIQHHSMRDHVHLLGVREDIPALLKSCDTFVFPSLSEGLPNAVLEAMAAACPIVCTDIPANRDLIHDRETGRVVPVNDSNSLAEAVLDLLADPAAAKRMGQNAFHRAQKDFSLTSMYDKYLELYAELCDTQPA